MCFVVIFVTLFFFSSRRRHTRCALVTGVQTCALPIFDGRYVELPVVGDYPDVWEADWEAARAGVRALGRAYQADGGRAATARAVAAANREIQIGRASCRERVCQSV